jgi:hypothetical protein
MPEWMKKKIKAVPSLAPAIQDLISREAEFTVIRYDVINGKRNGIKEIEALKAQVDQVHALLMDRALFEEKEK